MYIYIYIYNILFDQIGSKTYNVLTKVLISSSFIFVASFYKLCPKRGTLVPSSRIYCAKQEREREREQISEFDLSGYTYFASEFRIKRQKNVFIKKNR